MISSFLQLLGVNVVYAEIGVYGLEDRGLACCLTIAFESFGSSPTSLASLNTYVVGEYGAGTVGEY